MIAKFLIAEKSQLLIPKPGCVFRARLPYVPSPAWSKRRDQAQQTVRTRIEFAGLTPVALARCPPVPTFAMSFVVTMVRAFPSGN